MGGTRCLFAFAALAVVVSVSARPGDSNDINATAKKPVELNETVAPLKPVNERNPWAVLFGGTCGGSIISPTWVLTAGHCTISKRGRTVLAGTGNSEDLSGTTVRVKRLVIHPRMAVGPYWLDGERFGLNQTSARFDFLLVELKEPLPIDNKTIAAIPLDDDLNTPVGLDVQYAGYGSDHHGGYMQSEMHERQLTVMADDVCAKFVEFDKQDMLCTKGRTPRSDSACNGDSGSGLVGDGKLIGVASWVEDDNKECHPGAMVFFSRVARVRDWIREVTGV